MTAVQWFLVILFLILAVLLVMLIFARPPVPVRKEQIHIPVNTEEADETECVLPESSLRIRFPCASVYFDTVRMHTCLLLSLKHQDSVSESLLLVCSEEGTAQSLFNVLQSMSDESGELPAGLYIAFTSQKKYLVRAGEEASRKLLSENRKIRLVNIEGGFGILENGADCEILGMGGTACAELSVQCPDAGIEQLRNDILKNTPYDTDASCSLIRSLGTLPFWMRLQTGLPFLKRKAAANLSSFHPELAFLFAPVITFDHGIRISAQNDVMLERTLTAVRRAAEKRNAGIYMRSQRHAFPDVSSSDRNSYLKLTEGCIPGKKRLCAMLDTAVPSCCKAIRFFPHERGSEAEAYYGALLRSSIRS